MPGPSPSRTSTSATSNRIPVGAVASVGEAGETLRPYEMFRERQCRMTRRIANQAATPSRMFPIHIDQSGSMFPRFACAISPTISG